MAALTAGISSRHEIDSRVDIRMPNSHRIDSGALYIGYVCGVFYVFGEAGQ